MLNKLCSVIAAAALVISSSSVAFAAGSDPQMAQQGALAPGNAASVHQAQSIGTHGLLIAAGAIVLVAGVVFVVAGGHSGKSTTSTTSTTN
jgi:hypothetical protein